MNDKVLLLKIFSKTEWPDFIDHSIKFRNLTLHRLTEWADTQIDFELSKEGNRTKIVFTHKGLTPEVACYNSCTVSWTDYLQDSLLKAVTKSKKLDSRHI